VAGVRSGDGAAPRDDGERRRDVLLAVQRALVGEISPGMRAVAVEIGPAQVWLYVFHDGEADEDEIDDFDAAVVAQLESDAPELATSDGVEPEIGFSYVRVDEPAPLPVHGHLVYARKGTGIRPV
jgi:hypothetical protein